MRRAFFSKSRAPWFVLSAALLYACAQPEGGPPNADGGSSSVDTGGTFAQGSAGTSVGVSGTLGQSGSLGASGAVGQAGTLGSSGSGNTGFAGSSSTAGSSSGGGFGTAGSAGSSSSGGASGGGVSSGGTSAGGSKGSAGSSAGGGSAAGSSGASCSVSIWSSDTVYMMGDKASKNGMTYTAAYYTQKQDPTDAQNCCGGGKPWASSAPCN